MTLRITLVLKGENLFPPIHTTVSTEACHVTRSFPCALFWHKSGDQLPARTPGTPDLPSVVVTLPTSTLSASSSRKEVFPSNKAKELVPYRRLSMQVTQLLQLTFARAPSTFPVSLLDMGAEGPYQQSCITKKHWAQISSPATKEGCTARPWAWRWKQ